MELLPLFGLALVDSLSAGTLVIPLVLLISWGRMRPFHYGTYLGTIAIVYFGIGVGLFFGMRWVFDVIDSVTATTWFAWVTLALGLALLAFGVLSPTPKKRTVDEIVAKRSAGMGAGKVLVFVMIAPALLFGFLVALWGEKLSTRLIRIIPRLEYETRVTIFWIAAIVGFYMTANAVTQLGLLG